MRTAVPPAVRCCLVLGLTEEESIEYHSGCVLDAPLVLAGTKLGESVVELAAPAL